MGRDLFESFEGARELFLAADEQLGMPLSRLMFSGPESELTRTSICQPALFLHGYTCFELLRRNLPDLDIPAAAGLSLGEFTAHAAAGSFSFASGLDLVASRGRFMEEASAAADGIMAVMSGCGESEVAELAAEFGVVIANHNTPAQFVISGVRPGVEGAVAKAEREGICATTILPVSGAFHSALMDPARERLGAVLEQLDVAAPAFPVICNVEARPIDDPVEVRKTLRRQVTEPVRWSDCLRWLIDRGETVFVELGPGKSLAGMMKRIGRGAAVHSIGDRASLETALEALA